MSVTFWIPKGADKTWRLTALDAGVPIDLTGAKVWATVKTIALAQSSGAVTFKRRNTAAGGGDTEIQTSGGGLTTGQLDLKMVPSNTSGLTPGSGYLLDVFIETASSKRYQIVEAQTLEVRIGVTTDFSIV